MKCLTEAVVSKAKRTQREHTVPLHGHEHMNPQAGSGVGENIGRRCVGSRPGLAASPARTTLVHGLSTRYLDGLGL